MVTKGILGTKGATQQAFSSEGVRMPVTEIHTSPCFVAGIKSPDTDGYWAVRLGFGATKAMKKSQNGVTEKAGIKAPLRFLREIRFDNAELIEDGKKKGLKIGELTLFPGDELKAQALFSAGDMVAVTGISKGKGFQGVVKRHGFAGGPKTHGQSDRLRAPGSIGTGTTPGRVYKGKKMAGRMGGDTVTVRNLAVIEVGDEFIKVKGLVPGAQNGLITIRSAAAIPVKQIEVEVEPEEVKTEPEVAEEVTPVEVTEAPAEVKEDTNVTEETVEA